MLQQKKLLLANPRGFCAGVERAIAIVERALEKFGKPIYVRHEVVHNTFVCDNLRKKGAIFVENLDDVPENSTLIFSAHGVSKAVRNQAKQRNLTIFDATCPLVTKVHLQVNRLRKNNQKIIMIGHAGHPEVEGTMGQSENGGIFLVENSDDVSKLSIDENENISYVTQTTLSVDDAKQTISALQNKFKNLQAPKNDDICFATQNRQDAVKKLAEHCDLIIVVGSQNSSNSRRLKEVAISKNCRAFLVDSQDDIQTQWLDNHNCIGITAGASAPEYIVKEVVNFIENYLDIKAETLGDGEENINFALPKELL